MPELMRHNARGQVERMADLMQVVAELTHDGFLGEGAGQEPSIGGQRIEGAKESQALGEFTDKRIHRDHAFGLHFAERHMNRPLIGTRGAKAILGQVGALADADAGVANQEKSVAAQIVAAEELLLEELVLQRGERAWKALGETRNVLAADQLRQFGELSGPSQFIENAPQLDEPVDARRGGQRRRLRAQARHPAEDVWIAAQLI